MCISSRRSACLCAVDLPAEKQYKSVLSAVLFFLLLGNISVALDVFHSHLFLSFRGCSSSETESEAGDLLDQQFEELNNKLNSVTDPTGFLRMVSRNNLFNR